MAEVAKKKSKKSKVAKVMKEYKTGTLRDSSGSYVKSKKQAVAIALSEAGLSKKDKAEWEKIRKSR